MKTTTALHLSRTVAAIVATNPTLAPHHHAETVHELHRLGAAFRRRLVNTCNYKWATTTEYEARTDKMAVKLHALAAKAGYTMELCWDCRGLPVKLTVGLAVFELGGE